MEAREWTKRKVHQNEGETQQKQRGGARPKVIRDSQVVTCEVSDGVGGRWSPTILHALNLMWFAVLPQVPELETRSGLSQEEKSRNRLIQEKRCPCLSRRRRQQGLDCLEPGRPAAVHA